MPTAPDHVVVVNLENQDFGSVVGNAVDAPFLNQLIAEGMLLTSDDALAHPSQPNYLALFSGSTQGVTNSTIPSQFPASVPTLASALAANGLTFAGYAESGAAPQHTPWMDFANSVGDNQPFSNFAAMAQANDFSGLPTVSFITPNDLDNMSRDAVDSNGQPIYATNDAAIQAGDSWLQTHLAAYAAWAQANNSLLVVTFDENNGTDKPNQIATLVVGAGVPAGVTNSAPADQYSLLSTIEHLYGLTPIGESAGAAPLDFYSTSASTTASDLTTSFSGISVSSQNPPFNGLAVGPGSIVTAEAGHFLVTDLAGNVDTNGSLFSLFHPLGDTLDNSLTGAQVAFDPANGGHFVVVATNFQHGGGSNIDIAVSVDSNPDDGWSLSSIDTSGGTAPSGAPSLSVSDGFIAISAPASLSGGDSGTGEWIVDEANVGGAATIAADNIANVSSSYAAMRSVKGDGGAFYFAGVYSNGSETILNTQSYDPGTQTFSAIQRIALGNSDTGPSGGDYSVAQPGTSKTLDIGGSGIQDLAYANGYLWGVSVVQPVGASAPELHWFKLDVSDPGSPQLVLQGDISGLAIGSGVALFNASIAVDGNGDVLVNFTAGGANLAPSDYYVVWGANDSGFGSPTLYQSSDTSFDSGSLNDQRWGTHSTAVPDPNNANGFWISNEYVSNAVTGPGGAAGWWDTTVDQVECRCFFAGVRILTPQGERPVETLRPGDLVVTHDGSIRPILWLGRQTISMRFADPQRVLPIRIKAGALADSVPRRDLLLSPDHALFIGRVLIHAGALVNGDTIVRETQVAPTFVYYHIELADHSLVLADGTPAETFVDNVDRLAFDNWAEHECLFPDGRPVEELPHPRAKASRQVPYETRIELAARAGRLGSAQAAA